MDSSTNELVARYLNVNLNRVIRVEVWANCLFAVVSGLGGRFVSKKILPVETVKKEISGIEYAYEVARLWNRTKGQIMQEVNGDYIKATVWTKKAGEIRIYFGSLSKAHVTLSHTNQGLAINIKNAPWQLQQELLKVLNQVSNRYVAKRLYPAKSVAFAA